MRKKKTLPLQIEGCSFGEHIGIKSVLYTKHIDIKSVLCVERKPINSIVNMEKLFERHDAYLQGVQHKEALAKKMTI